MSDRRRHVVHVIGSLRTGGAEMMLVNLMGALAGGDDFRYSVLCLAAAGDLAPRLEALGVPVHVRPVRMRRLLRDVADLGDWLRREDAAVVHSHMFYATLWSQLAGRRAGVPLFVTTEHGKELWKNPLHVAVGRWLSRRTYRHLAVSQDVAAIRRERHGIPAHRLEVVPNAVPVPPAPRGAEARRAARAALGLPPDAPVIGSVGRVVPAKAYPDLLAAVALARRTRPDLLWLHVGDGPDLPALRALARERGLEGAVVFAGRRDDVPALLPALDVWVMSSVREGLPVALLEAMAAACPVVATRVGGIPDAVADGESARLVPPGAPAALAAGVLELLDDAGLAARLGTAARGVVEARYGIAAVAARVEAVYRAGLAAAP